MLFGLALRQYLFDKDPATEVKTTESVWGSRVGTYESDADETRAQVASYRREDSSPTIRLTTLPRRNQNENGVKGNADGLCLRVHFHYLMCFDNDGEVLHSNQR